MTRRITVVMVLVVVATLLIAGLLTVALTQARATRATEDRLTRQLDAISLQSSSLQQLADRLQALPDRPGRRVAGRDAEGCPVLALRRALQLRDAVCVLVEGDGTVTNDVGNAEVAGLPTQLDAGALASGAVVHGAQGGTVWAAKGLPVPGAARGAAIPTIVFTQDVTSELQPVRRWLGLAAVITLALGVAAAV